MRTTCIISHFNYGQYIDEACESALAQSVPVDEILVVDDGSTDGSRDRIRTRWSGHERIRLIEKAHEGQLSCFNAGFAASSGEVVFFLDADDVWEPRFVEAVLGVYETREDLDFVFTGHRKFGAIERDESVGDGDRDLGYSVIYTLVLRRWIGAPTSCLSMRRRILDRILPIPYVEDWRTRADDCLVFGASAVGARKFYLERPLVKYRIHRDNVFQRRAYDRFDDYRRKLAINRLLALLARRMGYDVPRLGEFAHREFRTIARPDLRQLRHYLAIARRARVPWGKRLGMMGSMIGYWLRRGARYV